MNRITHTPDVLTTEDSLNLLLELRSHKNKERNLAYMEGVYGAVHKTCNLGVIYDVTKITMEHNMFQIMARITTSYYSLNRLKKILSSP